MGRTIDIYVATEVSVVKPQLDPAKAFMTLRAISRLTRHNRGGGAEGGVGIQRDFQDFKGSVQRGHLVTDSHLWVDPGQVGVRSEQSNAGFLGSMRSPALSPSLFRHGREKRKEAVARCTS